MSSLHQGNCSASVFILVGFPGLEEFHFWLALLLGLLLALALLGNGAIIHIVRVERSLHQPMYLFLRMLAANDILLSLSMVPKMVAITGFSSTSIAFDACLLQMFCTHSLLGMELSLLLTMAFDPYDAICHPLSHSSILTGPRISKIGLGAAIRGAASMAPFSIFLKRLPFCRSNVLSHPYCLHGDVLKLACASIKLHIIYGLVVILLAIGLDSLLISLSYVFILKTALSLSQEARLKALGTCFSHLSAVFLFFVPFLDLSISHRFQGTHGSNSTLVLANLHLLMPPVLNPLVDRVKTKEIQHRVTRSLHRMGLRRTVQDSRP